MAAGSLDFSWEAGSPPASSELEKVHGKCAQRSRACKPGPADMPEEMQVLPRPSPSAVLQGEAGRQEEYL